MQRLSILHPRSEKFRKILAIPRGSKKLWVQGLAFLLNRSVPKYVRISQEWHNAANKEFFGSRLHSLLTLLIVVFSQTSCSHITPGQYGIQKDQLAFVPARIAVLSCRLWPTNAPYQSQPLTNLPADQIDELCAKIDEFILDGFRGQPYMRGLSPKVVTALLAKSDGEQLLSQMGAAWQQGDSSCSNCPDPVSYYQNSLGDRESWLVWLESFSKKAYLSDAVLLPLLTYAQQGRVDDRGMLRAYYKVGLVVLLIDTGNGRLIWAGGRDAILQNRMLKIEAGDTELQLPPQAELEKRLLLKDIWKDFPGRQN